MRCHKYYEYLPQMQGHDLSKSKPQKWCYLLQYQKDTQMQKLASSSYLIAGTFLKKEIILSVYICNLLKYSTFHIPKGPSTPQVIYTLYSEL